MTLKQYYIFPLKMGVG